MVAAVVIMWPRAFPQPPLATPSAPVAPTLRILTWGEHDGDTDAISATNPTPAHIVVAQLEITAGDTALSIPALGTTTPANRLWLATRDTGRPALTIQASRTADHTLWLPSRSAKLVRDFADEPMMFPDAGCTDVAPGDRCQITVVWQIGEHGTVAITSLALLPADTDPATSTPTAALPWPAADTAQPVCDGPIKAWCNNA